jgi:hypothetical protein
VALPPGQYELVKGLSDTMDWQHRYGLEMEYIDGSHTVRVKGTSEGVLIVLREIKRLLDVWCSGINTNV